jgi:hypothetical protein
VRARAKLSAFLEALLARVGAHGDDSPVDDLLTRATEAADHAGHEPDSDDWSFEPTDERLA